MGSCVLHMLLFTEAILLCAARDAQGITLTNSSRKCIEISLENLYVDIGA